jgi:hypothetical protein
MLAHGCGAADARLTASARSGLQVAGRGAGTGAPTEHRNSRKRCSHLNTHHHVNAFAIVFTRFLASDYTWDDAYLASVISGAV